MSAAIEINRAGWLNAMHGLGVMSMGGVAEVLDIDVAYAVSLWTRQEPPSLAFVGLSLKRVPAKFDRLFNVV